MTFSRFNQPKKNRKAVKRSPYSEAYIEERRDEMHKALAATDDKEQQDLIIRAFNVSIKPYRP